MDRMVCVAVLVGDSPRLLICGGLLLLAKFRELFTKGKSARILKAAVAFAADFVLSSNSAALSSSTNCN